MRAASLLIVFALAGCAGDFDVEKQTYPCRMASDCVDGYICHPTRWVCVPKGSDGGPAMIVPASDAGARDR
jgi:hypothetical protein